MFEIKGQWFRFSDEGVAQGTYDVFYSAGYLSGDVNSWFLTDPVDNGRPFEGFGGITVVLVSPKWDRVKEFLKQPKSRQCYMPVWSLDELLECRLAVFPHVDGTDVKEAFGKVGGVARAVFDPIKNGVLQENMKNAVADVDVGYLKNAVSLASKRVSTDFSGDKLFHIVPISGYYDFYNVTHASEYSKTLVVEAISSKGIDDLKALVLATYKFPKIGSALGGGVAGRFFEILAHQMIGGKGIVGEGAGKRTFSMEILSNSSSEVLLGRKTLSFDFTHRKEFPGQSFPGMRDIDISGNYCVPVSQTFAAIDSFGVNSGGDTLYFFQMKHTGVEKIKNGGTAVEGYWKTARKSSGASIKNCVFVYVVPKVGTWQEATKVPNVKVWLNGTSPDFRCDVCVIEIPLD